MGAKVEIVTDESRFRPAGSEVERLWADNSKAKELIGWTPAFAGKSGFKRGLLETANWFSKSENLSQYKVGIYNV
jgi:dTDP-glucose 4,6-dehydratase